MFGAVPHGKMVRRAGARPGDRVVVTGTIGDAALGLILRQERSAIARWGLAQDQQDHLMRRYLVPEPRIAIAEALRAHASAAMDVSDGLAGDLAKLCRVSGVAADIEVTRVPLSDAARAALAKEPALIETIVGGGDDYEVLACVPPDKLEALRRQATAAGVAITDIGTVAAGQGQARFVDARGQPLALARPSFSHF
jgi:thiamine-monophosphate kinase